MKSMTFGVMPTFEEFETAFQASCPQGVYRLKHGVPKNKPIEEGEYSVSQLWDQINILVTPPWDLEKDNSAINWASTIMHTLGFEWI
jgi:hypothetical protein